VILLKTYKLLYKPECVSSHPSIDEVTQGLSIDVVTQDPTLPSADVAAQLALSSVRVRWNKLATHSDKDETKQLLTTRNENVLRASLLPSIDVVPTDVKLPSADVAAHITLSSVCFAWWKLVTRSVWRTRKHLLMITDVVCNTLFPLLNF
jgi:hypothetical protein